MWLVDLGSRRLFRHRAPENGSYTVVDEPDSSQPLAVKAAPGLAVGLHRSFG